MARRVRQDVDPHRRVVPLPVCTTAENLNRGGGGDGGRGRDGGEGGDRNRDERRDGC